jgi:signal transduction histidine kinase
MYIATPERLEPASISNADETVILEARDFGKGIPEERLRLLQGASAATGVGLAWDA